MRKSTETSVRALALPTGNTSESVTTRYAKKRDKRLMDFLLL